jgi:hypothetical protein
MKIKKYFLDYDFNLKERFFDGKVIIDFLKEFKKRNES